MKSFKKITAGVCSLVMLSSIATYAVSADLTTGDSTAVGDSTTTVGDSNTTVGDSNTTVGDSKDDTTVGDSYVEVTEYVTGDLNGDGVFDGRDLLYLKKYVIGLVPTLNEVALSNADVNHDGGVDGRDLILMKKVVLGLIEDFPAAE